MSDARPLEPSTPRIPPLPPEEWGDDVRAGLAALRPAGATQELRRSQGGPKGLNVLGTLAQHPALMQAYHTFNGHILYTNTLDARQRELLVLRVAARRGAEYEWRQHVVIARDLGYADADIERIAEGPHADGWSPIDAAMLRAVDELLADAQVADETWELLASELDTHQLMDLVFTVGAYDLLAMAFKSFGVEIDDDLAAT
jgi:alkylhydroperoxidase family enzyme